MTKKVTPQEFHQAYVQSVESTPDSEQFFGIAPNWDDLSEEERAIMQKAARELSLVVSEWIVDD